MGKRAAVLLVGVLSFMVAGCITAQKVVRERVDQDISGNRGVIIGSRPAPEVAGPKTREYIDIRVEIPTWEEMKKDIPQRKETAVPLRERTTDKQAAGNRGYIGGAKGAGEEFPPVYKPIPQPSVSMPQEEMEEVFMEEEVMPAPKTYKVKEGDSLSKLAKEFYGKASKWTVIYEANVDRIKDPNRLKVGTVLVIPPLPKEAKSEDIK